MSNNTLKTRIFYSLLFILVLTSTLLAQPKPNNFNKEQSNIPSIESLWKEPLNISELDLYFGEGGSQNLPIAPFKYLKKDTSGSQKKFTVEDAHGIKWKVKVGEESQCETVAVRLLWAAGYYTDMTYYLPEIQVEGVFDENSKGTKIFSTKTFYGARMELVRKEKKIDRWKWHKNPFIGTKEFDGLKVMMMLINNWDLKQENNVILENKGKSKYYVADLGASFGKTGIEMFGRSKNNIKDFSNSKFVKKVSIDKVDFSFHTRPLIFLIFYPSYYFERSKAGKIAKGVPRENVRWIGELLSKLSDKQLNDAFRAANYSPDQAQKFVLALRSRINQIASL
ncbi:MAG: hypothetical protein HY819_13105 [Acidobacteria bacterium]|nr:hypothetical protein [Acidobacteriota bacterium]